MYSNTASASRHIVSTGSPARCPSSAMRRQATRAPTR